MFFGIQKWFNPLSVEDVKVVLLKTLRVGYEFSKAVGDGLQFSDLGVVFANFPDINDVVFRSRAALAQLKNYSPEKADEVTQYIKDNFELANDVTEAGIEEAVELVNDTYKEIAGDFAIAARWDRYAKTYFPRKAA